MKPLSQLTRLLVTLLKINIGITALAVLAGIYGFFEYVSLPAGAHADEILLPSDVLNALVGVIQVLFFIFLGVTFLRWIYRANRNLHFLTAERMTFSPGWSVGWYFIPIANLFKPYQAMKEIWSVAHRGASNGGNILGWWWFLWIVSTFLDRAALKLALRAEGRQGYITSAVVYMLSDGIDVVLNVVALMLVTAIARAYAENYVEPGAPPSGGPATQVGASRVSEGPPSAS